MLNKTQIEKNIDWLLKNGTEPVRFMTVKHLLKYEEPELKDVWKDLRECDEVCEIFSKQEEDGSWCAGGSWATEPKGIPKAGYSAFTPKYNTTVWVLSVLGDMGIAAKDDRVKKAVEYTMRSQYENGLFSRFKLTEKQRERQKERIDENTPCELSVFLLGLAKTGASDIVSLDKSFDLLRRFQRDDGGWVLETHRL